MRGLDRNVLLLSLCQALANTATVVAVAVIAIVGTRLAPDVRLATLPATAQFLGTMAAIFPASFLMRRFGRRPGFVVGALLGLAGGLAAALGVVSLSFALYVAGAVLHGGFMAFAQFYRFAAADAAAPQVRGRAISLVVAGGVVGGLVGPELAGWSRSLTAGAEFAGSHLAMAALAASGLVLLAMVRIPRSATAARSGGRSLGRLVADPTFAVAAFAAAVGFASMSLIMTVTPLAVVAHDHGFTDAAWVIQWHVIAMFAPSFVTGWVIERLGVHNVIALGAVATLTCVGINLAGENLEANFWPALVLLGLGWNFMYVGGTTLLTRAYAPEEKAKAQAANDFLVFTLSAAATLASGALYHAVGWQAVNIAAAPAVALVVVAALWHKARRPVAA